jgi:hypothetical protein
MWAFDKERFMRLINAKRVAEAHGYDLSYDDELRLYVLKDVTDGRPNQWFPGIALKNMSSETFRYFYMRVPLEKILGTRVEPIN